MQLTAFMDVLEGLAPKALAEEWDNPGLLVEPVQEDITRVLVALDCTPAVVREAAQRGAQLVLTHHPLFFKPVRRLYYSDPETAAACELISKGIGLYAAHTNLDSAINGVNDALAAALGLGQVTGLQYPGQPLSNEKQDIGRVGLLSEPLALMEFAKLVEDKLHTSARIAGEKTARIRRVAVIGGSGGSFLQAAKQAGADVLVTGEVKHDQALAAAVYGICAVEAGHYETEHIVLQPWIDGLQRALKEIKCNVEFVCAESQCTPLTAL